MLRQRAKGERRWFNGWYRTHPACDFNPSDGVPCTGPKSTGFCLDGRLSFSSRLPVGY
jgi:hypothetical protein